MNAFLSRLDRGLIKIINYLVGISMVILTTIIFIQVIMRYIFKIPIGGVEELPVYLMMFSIWLTGIVVARDNNHIKLELLPMFIRSKRVLKLIDLLLMVIITISLGIFTYLAFKYVHFGYRTGEVSAGLGFPLWWLTSSMFVSGCLMTLYYLIHIYRLLKEMVKWKSS